MSHSAILFAPRPRLRSNVSDAPGASGRDRHAGVSCIAILALACFGFVNHAWAQKDSGSIVGVVRDPSGAVVARAQVKATEVDQGTSVSTSTNASGEYVVTPLRIGRYDVTVEKQGF